MHRFLAIGTFLALAYTVGQGTLTTTGVGVWFVPSGGGATPSLVTHAQGPSTEAGNVTTEVSGTTTCGNYTICFPLPDAVLSHNGVVAAYRYGAASAETATVTDDQGNTYTCATEVHDATHNQFVGLCYALNLTNGPRIVKVTLNSGCGATGCTQGQVMAGQLYNVTAADGSAATGSNTGSATTFSTSSITTGFANDLIYQAVFVTNPTNTASTNNAIGTITFGSGWSGVAADPRDGASAQWEVAASAGSVTPSETISAGASYLSIAQAFKAGSQGAQPSGMYIACRGSYNSEESSALSPTVQMPCMAGNLLHAALNGGDNGGTGIAPGTPTDGANTWTQCTTNPATWQTVPWGADYFVSGASIGNTEKATFNVTWNGGTGDVSVWWDAVAGASAVPGCSNSAAINSSTGTLSGSNFTPTTTYQPQASSSLTFTTYGVQFNTNVNLSSPCTNFDATYSGGESLNGPWQEDQNNSRNHCLVSGSNAAQTWTNGFTSSTQNPDGEGGFLASYPVPGAVWTPQQVNCQGTASPLTCAITLKHLGDALVAVVGQVSSAARTVSSVCDNGTTCGTGHAFTQATSAACADTAFHEAEDVWYFFNYTTSGSRTIQVNYSGAVSNSEIAIYEVAGISAFDLANHNNSQSVSGGVAKPPAITTTGNPGFAVGAVSVSTTVTASPSSGNEFNDLPGIWSNTTDGWAALVSTSAASHQPSFDDGSGTYCGTNAAFK